MPLLNSNRFQLHKTVAAVSLIILLLGLTGAFQPVAAQESQTARPAQSALSDPLAPPRPDPLRVAFDPALWPFSFKNNSSYSGFEHELWHKLANNMGVEYEMIPMPFEQIINALEQEEIDVAIAVIPVTPARQARVAFSLPYYRTGLTGLCRQPDPDEPSPKPQPAPPARNKSQKPKKTSPDKFDTFSGKTVGVQRNSAAETFARENFKESRLVVYDYKEEMFFGLLAHNIDIVFAELSLLEAYLNVTKNPELTLCGPVYKKHNLAIALPKDSTNLKDLNRSLQALRQTDEFKDMCLKWFGVVPSFTRQ